MAHVIQLARALGWRVYHTHNSRHSPAGYPDLTLVKGKALVYMELKMPGNLPSKHQKAWLAALNQTPARVYLMTPDDMGDIETLLKERTAR